MTLPKKRGFVPKVRSRRPKSVLPSLHEVDAIARSFLEELLAEAEEKAKEVQRAIAAEASLERAAAIARVTNANVVPITPGGVAAPRGALGATAAPATSAFNGSPAAASTLPVSAVAAAQAAAAASAVTLPTSQAASPIPAEPSPSAVYTAAPGSRGGRVLTRGRGRGRGAATGRREGSATATAMSDESPSGSEEDDEESEEDEDSSSEESGGKGKGGRRAMHRLEAQVVLKRWFVEHADEPYPSDAEKAELARETGLTIKQVNDWFINNRKRVWKPWRQGGANDLSKLASALDEAGRAKPRQSPGPESAPAADAAPSGAAST